MTDEHPPTTVPPELMDEPPSAVAVYLLLREHEPASPVQLQRQGRLAPSTVTWALKKLTEAGVVEADPSVTGDARKTTVYSIKDKY